MSNLERIYKAIDNDLDYFKNYSSYLGELLTFVDYKVISDVVNSILKARENEKAIYFAGNGGSAATAAHFAQDLGGVGRKAQAEGFRTCSLTDNVSLITALGNDYGYDKIFSVQVEEKFKYGDVLEVFSQFHVPVEEVGGDAAVYVEPQNVPALAQAIYMGLTEEHKRNVLIQKGSERVKKYSWNICAEETRDVLLHNC